MNGIEKTGFFTAFGWSAFITVFSVAAIILFTSMTAYYLTRVKTGVTNVLYYMFVFSMIVPFQMVMFTLSLVADRTGLRTPWGIIIIYLGFGAGLAVFMFCGFVKSIPLEIEEAAIIDGCSSFMLFWRVVFPLIKPAVMTFSIINIFWYWNDYLMTQMMLTRPALRTIQLSMQTLFNEAFYAWDTALAALTLSLIPILIVFTLLQKNVLEGISAGAVKG